MKIAIMTWQYFNYGTLLQAFALQNILENQGHSVKIINYETQKKDVIILNKYDLRRQVKRISTFVYKKYYTLQLKKNSIVYQNEIMKRQKLYEEFIHSELHMTQRLNKNELSETVKWFDAFIVGSDQVWNPKYLDKSFFLDFVSGKKKISYAPSFGVTDLDNKTLEFIRPLIGDLDKISVRELQGLKIIENELNLNGTIVLDPTLLLDKNEWINHLEIRKQKKEKIQQKYILCYFLGNNEYYWNIVEQVQKKLGIQVVVIPCESKAYEKKYKKVIACAPFDFVDLIANSEYVITDSFHGTAFAINMERSFLTLARFKDTEYNSENSRVLSLLNILKLNHRWIDWQMEIPDEICISEKCYSNVKQELINMREKSMDFLLGSLKYE